jgi:hypothetical protein
MPAEGDETSRSHFNLQLALQLLVLQCMSLTIDEIVEYQDRLRREIVERECLLAAFNVLHGYVANDRAPKSLELGRLVSALVSSSSGVSLAEPATELSVAPAAAALPPQPPVPPYIHPELKAIANGYGSNGKIVSWAIQQMTDDYSLRDIAALLEREGSPMRSADISVVLTRLKSRGEIEEVERARGPIGSVFRKPESATSPDTEPADQTDSAARPVESNSAA